MRRNRTVAVIVAAIFFQNLVFAYVIERLFWEARSMSVQDVVYTEFIYVALVLLLEIPAGILSDRGSRKAVLITAGVLQVLEFVIVALASRFIHFGIAVAVAAVAEVLVSGTRNALIYESLDERGESERFTLVLGRIEALDNVTVIGALLAGGFLAEHLGMEQMYWIAAAGNGVAVAFLVALPRSGRGAGRRKRVTIGERGSEVRRGLRLFATSDRLLTALVASIAVGGSIVYIDEFLSLHLRDMGLPLWSFGIVVGGAYLARAVGALAGERVDMLARRTRFFVFVVAGFLIAQFAFGFVGLWTGMGLIAVLYVMWGALEVLATARIHNAAEASFRATAESVASQIEQIAALVFGLVFAAGAKRFSIAQAFALTSAAVALVYAIYLIAARRAFPRS